MVEAWQGNPLIESILPLFDSLLLDSYGLLFSSQPGTLNIDVRNYSNDKTSAAKQVNPLKIVDQLPGDAPLVGRISLPEEGFHHFLGEVVDMALKLFSANKLGADTDLPGFDLSARELVRFPSGDFAFAGGSSRTERSYPPQRPNHCPNHSDLGYRNENFQSPCLSGVTCRHEGWYWPQCFTSQFINLILSKEPILPGYPPPNIRGN